MDLLPLDVEGETPLYRQLFDQIAGQIRSGRVARGARLPATRELAGLLGLNRTTVSAAYEMLESGGFISGHVGRGSFVTGSEAAAPAANRFLDWKSLLGRTEGSATYPAPSNKKDLISFVVSRPSDALFPLDEFRAACKAVLERSDLAEILQLGSPSGYEPLRGPSAESPWDPRLAALMQASGRAVTEDRLLPVLLAELADRTGPR